MFKNLGLWILNNIVLTSAIVIFSLMLTMIASNALWYQSGPHSSPIFNTRADKAANDKLVTNSVNRKNTVKTDRVQQIQAAQYDHELVFELQRGLAKHGLYKSSVDGLMGKNTQAAIIAFQHRYGMKITGDASVKLLTQVLQTQPAQNHVKQAKVLQPNVVKTSLESANLNTNAKRDWRKINVLPTPRPNRNRVEVARQNLQQAVKQDVKLASAEAEKKILAPVKAVKTVAIVPKTKPQEPALVAKRKSIGDIVDRVADETLPKEAAPVNNQTTALHARVTKPLVAKIQQGLRNYGISNINVDGQLNEKTTTAIRYFQRAHKLEIDGVPSPNLLKKMRELGTFNG